MSLAIFATPRYTFQDDNGGPASGWLLYTYEPGTSTPKATYLDYLGAQANTNPVVLDARGEAVIYMDGAYKFVLTDAAGVVKRTEDNVTGVGDKVQSGYLQKNVAGSGNVALTHQEQDNSVIELTGALTGNINVTVGDDRDGYRWILKNSTTGNYSITFKTTTGTGILVGQGGVVSAYCDQYNVNFADRSRVVSSKADAVLIPPSAGASLFVTSNDGGQFVAKTGASPGTYVSDGGSYCGTIIVPTGGDGSAAWVRAGNTYLRPQMFGAKGDGATDDTAAIQAAINAAPNGATIYFSSGVYAVGQLTITKPIALLGENKHHYASSTMYGTILKATAATVGGYLITIQKGTVLNYENQLYSVTLQNLGLSGNGRLDCGGVKMSNVDALYFENLFLESFNREALNFYHEVRESNFVNVVARWCGNKDQGYATISLVDYGAVASEDGHNEINFEGCRIVLGLGDLVVYDNAASNLWGGVRMVKWIGCQFEGLPYGYSGAPYSATATQKQYYLHNIKGASLVDFVGCDFNNRGTATAQIYVSAGTNSGGSNPSVAVIGGQFSCSAADVSANQTAVLADNTSYVAVSAGVMFTGYTATGALKSLTGGIIRASTDLLGIGGAKVADTTGAGTLQAYIETSSLFKQPLYLGTGSGIIANVAGLSIKIGAVQPRVAGETLNIADASSNVRVQIDTSGNLTMPTLPTSSAGLPAGALWRNAGVVSVV